MVRAVAAFLLSVVAATPFTYEGGHTLIPYNAPCKGLGDVMRDYRAAIHEFIIAMYRRGTALNNFHVVFAPSAMWTALAAIAEGANPETQQELFKFLHLPNDPCVRQAYYKLATTRILPGPDIRISSTRILVVDEGLTVNPDWLKYVSRNSLLDVISAPIKSNPEIALKEMRHLITAKLPKLSLAGNSVLLDAMDFSGLWSTAFPDALVERAPFYSFTGQKLGEVDFMKIKRHIRMGYAPNLRAKILQVPVGIDSRYFFLFGIVVGDGDPHELVQALKGSIIKEALDCLRESTIPLKIAIPKYTMTSELDARAVLEDLGMKNLWNNSEMTGLISEPAALPSSYVQRVTVSLHPTGAYPAPFVPEPPPDAPTGLDPRVGRHFIANKPHMFGLYDSLTHTCLVASAFSQPTYPL